jgi:YbbR domain-containing protein
VALGTAIILFTYVHGERNPQTTASVDATVLPLHRQDGYIARISPERISISLQGPKSEVDAVIGVLKSGEIRPTVDLGKLSPGVHNAQVDVAIPDGLAASTIVKPVVPTISVTIETKSSRAMTVRARAKNPPPIGFAVGEPAIDPAIATVSGASSLVNSVARLEVVTDLTTLRPSVDEDVKITAINSMGEAIKGLNISPSSAHIAVRLVEAPASKAVFVQPSVTGQPQFPYKVIRISVAPNSVTLKGKPERLAGTSIITTDDVDVRSATSDIVRYVGLHVPPGVEIEGSGSVKVTIKIDTDQNP